MGLVMIPVILLAAAIGLIFGNIPMWIYARKLHREFSEAAGKEPRWPLFYLSMIPAACLVLIVLVAPFVLFIQGTANSGAPTGDSLIIIVLSFFVFGLSPGLGLILAAVLWKLFRHLGVPDWVTGTAIVIAIFTVPSLLLPGMNRESTPTLIDAARAGDVGRIQLMLDEGADVNATDGGGISPLILAAASSDEAVEVLLAAGADTDIVSISDRTALIEAVNRSDNAAEMLIAAGADVNLPGRFGMTPLIEAVGRSDRVVELLIAAGADVNQQSTDGTTPLIKAAGRSDRAVELLLAAGADVSLAAKNSVTPLSEAAASGDKAVELLIAAGADAKARHGNTLRRAVLRGDEAGQRVVGLLIAAGADVNERDSFRRTPLMAAAGYSLGSTRQLLAAGADVNAIAMRGETALMKAAENGQTEIVKLLLEAGADWRPKDESGMTALGYAQGHWEITETLRQAGAKY